MATPTKRTRAAGDEEGDAEGGESDGDGDGDKEGDGEKEGKGHHSSLSSDRLPPCHMFPLLLRLVTVFRAVVGASLRRSFGVSSAAAFASSRRRQGRRATKRAMPRAKERRRAAPTTPSLSPAAFVLFVGVTITLAALAIALFVTRRPN